MALREDPEKDEAPCVLVKVADKVMPADGEEEGRAQWKPSTHELSIMISLSVISFMIALDASVIVTSLSVRILTLATFLNLINYLTC